MNASTWKWAADMKPKITTLTGAIGLPIHHLSNKKIIILSKMPLTRTRGLNLLYQTFSHKTPAYIKASLCMSAQEILQ